MKFRWGTIVMMMLMIVLYCERRHGSGKELADYSHLSAPVAPEWARRGVLYQVFPRVFTHQGTFRALEEKLDEIQKLDVDIIWLLPIYPIGEKGRKGTLGSPFSVRDFHKVNPELGTEADFRHLVQEIHRRGLKVIIGMVPNHASNDNVLMKEHPDWFMRDAQGHFTREVPEWSDITDFNYQNPHLREYMIETMIYWIREFDIDGYRCDVAGMVPLDFWKEAIPRLRAVKSDLYLLAEWEDPQLLVAGFNSDYDWTLYHLLKEIREGKKEAHHAAHLIAEKDARYPRNALPMRFLENHDEQRALAVFGSEAIQVYATFIFTVPGIPLIYAGQEIGERQKPGLFDKSELNWAEPDTALRSMYRELIRLRKSYDCFTEGRFHELPTNVPASLSAFARVGQNSAAVVVCNFASRTVVNTHVRIPDSVRQNLADFQMVRIDDPADTLNVRTGETGNLLPFSAKVYVGRRNSKSR